MTYYKTLYLDREPFSNSPDPGFFYQSGQHLQALQQLEIAVRLKRGLNVITGDVGTGKTTISRQLIQRLSNDPDIEYYLLLDPGFTDPIHFLSAILKLFTQKTDSLNHDENLIKEQIKNFLFNRAVDKGRTQVLLIDEGQKLSLECMELLRELLNYETNDEKLLQIVIFAQKEFNTVLLNMENVTDRINFRYALEPFGYSDTKGMIRFRLTKSGGNKAPGHLFSFLSYLAIFRYSKGYPRKIIHLCHHILLTLIVGEKQKAGFFFVRNCARDVFKPTQKKRIGFLPAGVAVIILMASVYFFNFPNFSKFYEKAKPQAEISDTSGIKTAQASANLISLPSAGIKADKPPEILKSTDKNQNDPPDIKPGISSKHQILGTIRVPKNATLYKMIEYIYGTYDPDYLNAIIKVNTRIKNPRSIQVGTALAIPIIKDNLRQWPDTEHYISIAEHKTLEQAYFTARQFNSSNISTKIINNPSTLKTDRYMVTLRNTFVTCDTAKRYLTEHKLADAAVCRPVASLVSQPESLARTSD